MKPTLLVLAAGMGSRYGGLKQMDGLGPNGETMATKGIERVHSLGGYWVIGESDSEMPGGGADYYEGRLRLSSGSVTP